MAPKKKMSREEQLLKKRLRERERYLKIKEDPIKRELQREKERSKYENKKKKKQVKSVKQMTDRELRLQRKKWRKYSNDYYKKKKVVNILPESPPSTDDDDSQVQIMPVQVNSGRKRIRRDRSKITYRNKRLQLEIEKLKRSREVYRKRYYRLINQHKSSPSKVMTPKTKVRRLIQSKDNTAISKRLLFAEALESQIKYNLKSIKSHGRKKLIASHIVGDKKILKKYKVTNEVNKIVTFKCARYSLDNNFIRKRRQEAFRNLVKSEVQHFLEEDENSRVAPGKKDVITYKKTKKQKRYLNDTLKNLYLKFICNHTRISYSYFCKCKPFWIVYQNLNQRDTCQCKTHSNMDYIISALKYHKIIDQKDAKEVVETLCCNNLYSVRCLQRNCLECQDKTVLFNEFNGSMDVFYYSWVVQKDQYTDKTGNNKFVNRVVKLRKRASALELVNSLSKILAKFMSHEAIILNQYSALKYLKSTMGEDEVLLQVDFSENYSLKYAEEIQSFHFGGSRKQITLHTSSLLFKDILYETCRHKSFCTFSENLKHDPPAVLAHLEPVFRYIKNLKPNLKVLHILSDSPSTQYRNKLVFYKLCNMIPSYFPSLAWLTWNYLEAGHGKGMPDGIGGTVKRTADRLVTQGNDLSTFEVLIELLRANLRSIEISVVTDADIGLIRDTIQESMVVPFKGTMKVHQAIHVCGEGKPRSVFFKSMSCFRCFHENKEILNEQENLTCKHFNLGKIEYHNPTDEENCVVHMTPEKVTTEEESQSNFMGEPSTNASPTINQSSTNVKDKSVCWIGIQPGVFLLVKINSTGKSANKYRYVCIVQSKDDEDGEIIVQGLRVSDESGTEFVVQEGDIFVTTIDYVDEKLPEPKLIYKKRVLTYKFKNAVDVYEKH